jgi:hypothetical protein
MKIVEELKAKLENASPEEIKILEQSEDPIYWFLLLAEYPEFAPDSSWWFDLRNRCDLPWSKLLAQQPQFEKYCHWESVSRLDLMLLAFKAPEIFKRKFPCGRAHDLEAFLTLSEKVRLLIEIPEYAEQVDWEELNAGLSIPEWFSLLAYRPQFEIYFDWSTVENKPNHYWHTLLKKQPQFAIHCDLEQLYPNQRKTLQKHCPKLFEI